MPRHERTGNRKPREHLANQRVPKLGYYFIVTDNNFDMFYDYSFERIFRNYFHFPQKRIVLTIRLRLLIFRYQVSTISESNFLCFTFWNDIWLSFANEQGKFSYTKLFSSVITNTIYWRKYCIFNIFRTEKTAGK